MLTFPTLIRGGSGINVVPSSCEAYGDVRLLPGTSPEEIRRLITEQLERFSIPNYQLDDLLVIPAAETDPQAEVVQTLAAAAITGTRPCVEGSDQLAMGGCSSREVFPPSVDMVLPMVEYMEPMSG